VNPPSPRAFADELIRQVAINSPERGLLLLRVRDEIRMTLDAYKTLYDSSVTFGIRKQLQAEAGMPEMEASIGELGERKRLLEAQVLALRAKLDVVERRQAERRVLDDKRRAEELSYLKHQAKHLDLFLKSMPKV
jgi:dynein light intermediate chain